MGGGRGTPSPSVLDAVASRIGHTFADPDLLELALRHRSWCAENGTTESNERLEFLGDAVLGLVVSERLYSITPELPEAGMSRRRSELVNSLALARLARSVDLGDALLLGKGEEATGGREKTSILADAMEAVIGAVYLDGGAAAAAALIERLHGDALATADLLAITGDDKSRLQELAARRSLALPRYLIEEEGPDHEKRFEATVEVDGRALGRGAGKTKKEAEQSAARKALAVLAEEMEAAREATGTEGDTASEDADGGEHARTA